ncbi:MFS transporter [Pseudonocardia adelaidensis]|uniref:MFS transporter n=2 Tax=Pseudonocardia adelaidensis TaxID=648754 RepID=A0ABP9NHZ8_9PSEU
MTKWWRIGAVLMFGLFIAYLDRSNLSIALPGLSQDMGFAGDAFADTSSWALTAFLFGYLAANLLGGFLTYRVDPKLTLVVTVAVFSTCTLLAGFVHSVGLLIALRVVLGFAEGIYWPQQFRVAKAWFSEREMSKGTAIIQYYGQYAALALGFFLLTPLYDALGWRPLFWITGLAGIVLVIPLYLAFLRSAPAGSVPAVPPREPGTRSRMRFADFGGPRFLLLVFSYFSNGMLFWGITLWIPLVIEALGFTGTGRGLLAALPYVLSLALTVPMMSISDRTGKRVLIASSGLLVGGALVAAIPLVDSPVGKLVLICVGMGYFTATYTSNLWAIAVTDLRPDLVGPATGIINGFGAGGGGIVAGFVVGQLRAATGSYLPGFVVLGVMAIIGGLALLAYGRLRPREPGTTPGRVAAAAT